MVAFIYCYISINMLGIRRFFRQLHAQAQLMSIVKQYLRENSLMQGS